MRLYLNKNASASGFIPRSSTGDSPIDTTFYYRISSFVLGVLCIFSLWFGCRYQCCQLPRQICLKSDLLCIKRDVKSYIHSLTHPLDPTDHPHLSLNPRSVRASNCTIIFLTVSEPHPVSAWKLRLVHHSV